MSKHVLFDKLVVGVEAPESGHVPRYGLMEALAEMFHSNHRPQRQVGEDLEEDVIGDVSKTCQEAADN